MHNKMKDMQVGETKFVVLFGKPITVKAVRTAGNPGNLICKTSLTWIAKCEKCVFRYACTTAGGINARFNAVGACFAAGRRDSDEVYFIRVED